MAPYREQLQLTINNLLEADREYESPLAQQRPVHRIALVLLASDEGLCGAYNSNLYKALLSRVSELENEFPGNLPLTFIRSGKRLFRQLIVPRVSICASVIIFMQKVHPMN